MKVVFIKIKAKFNKIEKKIDKLLADVKNIPNNTEELKKKWKKIKKNIDSNLIFVKRKKTVGEKKIDSFRVFTRKKTNPIRIDSNLIGHMNNMFLLWKYIKPTKICNIYIAFFSKDGFKNEEKDIVYIGETRKQSTGDYRRIIERWGYSGNDHGAEARKIIKDSSHKGQTNIDFYLANFNFNKQKAFVFLTSGIEKEIIQKLKKLSDETIFRVVNK